MSYVCVADTGTSELIHLWTV